MPSGFRVGEQVKKDKNDDSDLIKSEFIEQQFSATLNSINELTKMQAQQLQFNNKIAETLEAMKQPQKKEEEITPPEDFDITKIHDPNSDSGKYFNYLLEKRDKALESEIMKKVEDKVKTENFEKEIQQGMNIVKEKYKIEDDKMEEFKQWVNNPEGANLEVLYNVFETVKGGGKEEEEKVEELPPSRLSQVPGVDEQKVGKEFLSELAG
jgi:hypothetical protein